MDEDIKNKKISTAELVAELDQKTDIAGRPVTFSIGFLLDSGEYRYVHRAVVTGLKMNASHHARRGIQPVDADNQAISHIYPVSIWAIVEFNGKKRTM
jgi:hypothetical protein